MLYADWALELAAAASGALKCRFFGDVLPKERLFARRTQLVQVGSQAQDDFFRVQHLSGVISGTMLRAAAAFHARVRLQRVDTRDIFPTSQPEILIA